MVTTETGHGVEEKESIFRRTDGGQFGEAVRTEKTAQMKDGQAISNVVRYERDFTGRLQAASQEVTTTVKQADGSEVIQVNQYGFADGKARTDGGSQALKEQQNIIRKTNADGTVSETVSVRRPSLSDGNRLSDPQVISQTVCAGQCTAKPTGEDKPAAAAKP